MPNVPPLKAHLFICTNTREGEDSCGPKGALAMREKLKALVKSETKGWKGRVKVTTSGCLGHCSEGIACVMYPRGEWRLGQKSTDVEKLEAWIDSELKA